MHGIKFTLLLCEFLISIVFYVVDVCQIFDTLGRHLGNQSLFNYYVRMKTLLILILFVSQIAAAASIGENSCSNPELSKAIAYTQKRKAAAEVFAADEEKDIVSLVKDLSKQQVVSILSAAASTAVIIFGAIPGEAFGFAMGIDITYLLVRGPTDNTATHEAKLESAQSSARPRLMEDATPEALRKTTFDIFKNFDQAQNQVTAARRGHTDGINLVGSKYTLGIPDLQFISSTIKETAVRYQLHTYESTVADAVLRTLTKQCTALEAAPQGESITLRQIPKKQIEISKSFIKKAKQQIPAKAGAAH